MYKHPISPGMLTEKDPAMLHCVDHCVAVQAAYDASAQCNLNPKIFAAWKVRSDVLTSHLDDPHLAAGHRCR